MKTVEQLVTIKPEILLELELLGLLTIDKKKEEPEVDWAKVVTDTPVLVKSGKEDTPVPRYFSNFYKNTIYTWEDGKTSRNGTNTIAWKYGELDPSAPSIFNWIPNTGVKPNCKEVLLRYSSSRDHDGRYYDTRLVENLNFNYYTLIEGKKVKIIKDYIILR